VRSDAREPFAKLDIREKNETFAGHGKVRSAPFFGPVIPDAAGAGLISLSFGIDADAAPVYRQGVAVYLSRMDNAPGEAVFILP
jgi:hypothetical protein